MIGVARAAALAAGLLFACSVTAAIERSGDTVGEIVTAKGEETIRFIGSQRFQILELSQRLAPGTAVSFLAELRFQPAARS